MNSVSSLRCVSTRIAVASLFAHTMLWAMPVHAAFCATPVTRQQISDMQALSDDYDKLGAKLTTYHAQGAMFPAGTVLEDFRASQAEFQKRFATVKDGFASCSPTLADDYGRLDTYAKQVRQILDRVKAETRDSATDTSITFLDPIWHWMPTVNDASATDQYYIRALGFGENLLDAGKEPIIVAVIDSGVYADHEDFRDAMWVNPGEIPDNHVDDDRDGYIDDVHGWNFIDDSNDMTPKASHGTAVAGLIAAKPDNGLGIAGIGGNVRIMPITVCAEKECAIWTIADAVRYAVFNKAKVINLSLGSNDYLPDDGDVGAAIHFAELNNVTVVAAAGNGDPVTHVGLNTTLRRLSPVCAGYNEHSVIGVAATDSFNDLTSWSNYGNCVDVNAPGNGIVVTSDPDFSDALYEKEDGTSFASPLIAGMVARMLQIDSGLTPIEVRQLLISHTRLGVPYFADIAAAMIGAVPPAPAPFVQPTQPALKPVHGMPYDRDAERNAAVSINDDKTLIPASGEAPCVSNTLIKGKSSAAVYYCGADGKRFVFPDFHTYATWYDNFDDVITLTDEQLANVMIGGVVTYRPGTRMIKITSDPTVYAVSANGELRPISSEAVAKRLYGDDWNKQIDDVSDAFFTNYKVGDSINE